MPTPQFISPGAVRLTIQNILQGTYVQDSEQNPNYLLLENNLKVYRINLFAVVLDLQKSGSLTNILVEDGTGKIVVRFFEEQKSLTRLTPGSVVLIVGKLRMYNQEKYISPEICKQISPLWLKVRSTELNKQKLNGNPLLPQKEQNVNASSVEETALPATKIINLIKQLDSGKGADMGEVMEKSPLQNTEQILKQMLERGDIFQITPGKVKVL